MKIVHVLALAVFFLLSGSVVHAQGPAVCQDQRFFDGVPAGTRFEAGSSHKGGTFLTPMYAIAGRRWGAKAGTVGGFSPKGESGKGAIEFAEPIEVSQVLCVDSDHQPGWRVIGVGHDGGVTGIVDCPPVPDDEVAWVRVSWQGVTKLVIDAGVDSGGIDWCYSVPGQVAPRPPAPPSGGDPDQPSSLPVVTGEPPAFLPVTGAGEGTGGPLGALLPEVYWPVLELFR